MIPQVFLEEMAIQHHLTEAEQEILFPAVRGKTIAQIAENLDISTNAVRKRLGEIYSKVGVSGNEFGRRGPGKLNVLRQLLISQYQSRAMHRVMLCGFGLEGNKFVEKLRNTIFKYPQIEVELLDTSSTETQLLSAEVGNLLEDFEFVLVCITPELELLHWANFQIGFLAGRSRKFKLIRFLTELNESMVKLPSIDGSNPEEMSLLLKEITGIEIEQAKQWVQFQFEQLKDALKQLRQPFTGSTNVGKIIKQTDDLKTQIDYEIKVENPYFRENICFQSIILVSVANVLRQVTERRPSVKIPANLYPRYLIELQEGSSAEIQAVTIINHRENFWSEEIGRKIAESSSSKSKRVFVFVRVEDFDQNFEMLLEQAAKYEVYAIAYELLVREFKGFASDFAILKVSDEPSNEVLVKYTFENTYQKEIYFTPELEEIKKHRDMIQSIFCFESTIKIQKALEMIAEEVSKLEISYNGKFEFEDFRKIDAIREDIRTKFRKRIFEKTDVGGS